MTDQLNGFKEWRRLKAGTTPQTMIKAFCDNKLVGLVLLNIWCY